MRVRRSFSSRVIIVLLANNNHFKVGEIPAERQEPTLRHAARLIDRLWRSDGRAAGGISLLSDQITPGEEQDLIEAFAGTGSERAEAVRAQRAGGQPAAYCKNNF